MIAAWSGAVAAGVGVLVGVAVLLGTGRPARSWIEALRGARPQVRDLAPGRRRRDDASREGDLLAFLDILAPSLRAGRTPEEAARLACDVVRGHPVVDAIKEAVAAGRSIESVLRREARTHPEAAFLARAWHLSTSTGCPLAAAVESAARAVRAQVEHRRRVDTASTGAVATIRILTVLPLGGPVLAMAVGVDPIEAYVTSPSAWGCLLLGALLVTAGRMWMGRLVRSVARGPVLR